MNSVQVGPDQLVHDLTIVILGHVDHGKSTLVGRLLFDTGQVAEDRVDFVRQRSDSQGRQFEFAYLLDGLEEEQEQGITIDFTQLQFKAADRGFVIADAPGHKEFLKNMLSGASRAEAALLLIDAAEGVREQSRRHGFLLSMLGIRQLAVVVNKMDLVGWSEEVFSKVKQEYEGFLANLGIQAQTFIPASAYSGDNVVSGSAHMAWYSGPTVLEQMLHFTPSQDSPSLLRMPVQDVYRFGPRRLAAGRVSAGSLSLGQQIVAWPTREISRIKIIERWPETGVSEATTGESIAVELEDPLFIERGMVLASTESPPTVSRSFRGRIVWLGRQPLVTGQRCKLKLGLQETVAWVEQLDRVIDASELCDTSLQDIPAGFVGEGIICLDQPLVFDRFADMPSLGRFVLVDGYQIAGGGIVDRVVTDEERQSFVRITRGSQGQGESAVPSHIFPRYGEIGRDARRARFGHPPLVLWMTGLSGAGKSTLAYRLEAALFRRGVHVYVLDGDNLRSGLNQDLTFTTSSRKENIRRVGEVAKLFADAGFVVLTSLISPYRRDREQVRRLFRPEEFVEVFVKCPLDACMARDVKGLYRQARQGAVRHFTGIDDAYEEPEHPGIVIDTEHTGVEECVEQLLEFIRARTGLDGSFT